MRKLVCVAALLGGTLLPMVQAEAARVVVGPPGVYHGRYYYRGHWFNRRYRYHGRWYYR